MKLIKMTKGLILTAAALLLLAGGMAQPVQCGMTSCCCMPEATDDLAIQRGHCGCGCGQFEESQVPDQSAVIAAIVENVPVKPDFEYVMENDNDLFKNVHTYDLNQDKYLHPPPLILDKSFTPLLC